MFWLPYAITRNRSFAMTVVGITRAMNRLLKKKRVELLRPIPPVLLSPTTSPGKSSTRPVRWEALLHQHSSSDSPYTQHNSHVAEAVLLYLAVRGTAHSWKGYVQIGSKHLHAERNGRGTQQKNKQKTYHLSEGPRGTARGFFALRKTIEMS